MPWQPWLSGREHVEVLLLEGANPEDVRTLSGDEGSPGGLESAGQFGRREEIHDRVFPLRRDAL